jgi:hypothetical protein
MYNKNTIISPARGTSTLSPSSVFFLSFFVYADATFNVTSSFFSAITVSSSSPSKEEEEEEDKEEDGYVQIPKP